MQRGDPLQNSRFWPFFVVLSCSHSGRGRTLKGQGVVGIARAFLAADSLSVLVTLWEIDDEATMMFIKSFFRSQFFYNCFLLSKLLSDQIKCYSSPNGCRGSIDCFCFSCFRRRSSFGLIDC